MVQCAVDGGGGAVNGWMGLEHITADIGESCQRLHEFLSHSFLSFCWRNFSF